MSDFGTLEITYSAQLGPVITFSLQLTERYAVAPREFTKFYQDLAKKIHGLWITCRENGMLDIRMGQPLIDTVCKMRTDAGDPSFLIDLVKTATDAFNDQSGDKKPTTQSHQLDKLQAFALAGVIGQLNMRR